MVCCKAVAGPEGLQWSSGRRGGSRGLTMIFCKAGADPEGLS